MSVLIDALNDAVTTTTVGSRSGELARIADMFTDGVLDQMQGAFNATDTSGCSNYRLALGWIDKSPYAGLPAIDGRVELGDLAIVFLYDFQLDRPGADARPFTGRCALMQAKLQDNGVGPSLDVLFGKTDISSKNQLILLETWGQLELFRHSRGPGAGLYNLPLLGGSDYGWFMAAHRDRNAAMEQSSAWMCGRAVAGETCATTIGEAVASVAAFGDCGLGVPFKLEPDLKPSSTEYPDWNRLVAQIIEWTAGTRLPLPATRVAGSQGRLKGLMDAVDAARLMAFSVSSADSASTGPGRLEDGMAVLYIIRSVRDS